MVKSHEQVIKDFRGVDYSSNDIDRNVEYFKDSSNMELSYSKGIRGRLGYRPLLTGFGDGDVFKYETVNVEGEELSEVIVCNGHLWRVKETNIFVNGATTSSLYYDYNNLWTNDPTLSPYLPQFTLKVDNKTYPLSDRYFGEVLLALAADGYAVTYPVSTQTLNWGRITPGAMNNNFTIATTFSTPNAFQVNDIITVLMAFNSAAPAFAIGLTKLTPCVVVSISGSNIVLRPSTAKTIRNTSLNYAIASSYAGIYAMSATCITSVSNNVVYFSFLEPIPCVTLFKQLSTNYISTRKSVGLDHPYLGNNQETNIGLINQVDYSFVNASESLFISSNRIAPCNNVTLNLEPGPDFPLLKQGAIKEWLIAKYDSVRAYYAGCPKPDVNSVEPVVGGSIDIGTHYYAVIGCYRDARGRVVYGDYSFHGPIIHHGSVVGTLFQIYLAGHSFLNFGYGQGGTCLSNGTGTTTTTLNVQVPHGVQPEDTLYYARVISGGAGINRTVTFDNSIHEMATVRVASVRGAVVTLETAITYVDKQYFVAGQTLKILRTKIGGAFPNVYQVSEIPFPDFNYWNGYDGSGVAGNYSLFFKDTFSDASINTPFALPPTGMEGVRSRAGTSMAIFSGRLVVARGSNLYWSNPESGISSIEQTPLTNSTNLGGTSGGAITAIASVGDDSFYAFKRDAIHRLSSFSQDVDFFSSFRVSSIIEGDLGAASPSCVLPFGNLILVFGSGTFYAINSGALFTEIGNALVPKLRAVSRDWNGSISIDKTSQQVKLFIRKLKTVQVLDPTIPGQPQTYSYVPEEDTESFVLDLKKADTQTQSSDNLVLSRSVFNGSFFRWNWKIGAPTSKSVIWNNDEYYISTRSRTATYTVDGKKRWLNGLWVRWDEGAELQYCDAGLSIENMVNLTPVHKGELDRNKGWTALKFFRLLDESDVLRATDWQAVIDVIFGLSNNHLSLDENILKLESSVRFSTTRETQSIAPLEGNFSPAIEIKITTDTLLKSMQFSSLILDSYDPFVVDGVDITSKD